MKTRKEKLIKAVQRIHEINEAKKAIRALDSEHKALKSYVLSEMRDKTFLEAGSYVASQSTSFRKSLDKESMVRDGIELSKYETEKEVISLSVKTK